MKIRFGSFNLKQTIQKKIGFLYFFLIYKMKREYTKLITADAQVLHLPTAKGNLFH